MRRKDWFVRLPIGLAAAIAVSAMAVAEGKNAYPTPVNGQITDIIAPADADGNGKVDPAEWAAHGNAIFSRLDTDGNGSIDEKELDQRIKALADASITIINQSSGTVRIAIYKPIVQATSDQATTEAVETRPEHTRAILSVLDQDKDGMISRPEFQKMHDQTFADLDTAKDGTIVIGGKKPQ